MIDINNPAALDTLRRVFHSFNKFMVLMWRLGLGPMLNAWPRVLGRYMVIVHRGRKTGHIRYTPVNFAIVDGALYATAGFGAHSDWYRNIQAKPDVELWLPDGRRQAQAVDVSDSAERTPIMREVLIGSGFVAPLLAVDPHELSDAALAGATADYRLVRFDRQQAVVGPGGPGELAWVWPLGAVLLAPILLRRLVRARWHV